MNNIILRNYLFKILQNKTNDGWHPGLLIDGINRSEDSDEIAKKLVKLGCLNPQYSLVGRNSIQGTFKYEQIQELILSGKIG